MNMKATDLLTKQEFKSLNTISDSRALFSIFYSWFIINACFYLVYLYPSIPTVILALILIGGQQLGLIILAHDGAHRSLLSNKQWNNIVSQWLCSYPVFFDTHLYRQEHLTHHWNTGTDSDPDLPLYLPYPTSRKSLLRKFLRDLSGISGLKRLTGLFFMGIGYLKHTYTNKVERLDTSKQGLGQTLKLGIKNLHGAILANLFIFTCLYLFGAPYLYLLWIGAYLTTFSLYIRIRSIAEHACTPNRFDNLLNTRTTMAGPLAKLTVAPHYVNYHLEHHLFMAVPHYRLPELHCILKQKGLYETSPLASGYLNVLSSVII